MMFMCALVCDVAHFGNSKKCDYRSVAGRPPCNRSRSEVSRMTGMFVFVDSSKCSQPNRCEHSDESCWVE